MGTISGTLEYVVLISIRAIANPTLVTGLMRVSFGLMRTPTSILQKPLTPVGLIADRQHLRTSLTLLLAQVIFMECPHPSSLV